MSRWCRFCNNKVRWPPRHCPQEGRRRGMEKRRMHPDEQQGVRRSSDTQSEDGEWKRKEGECTLMNNKVSGGLAVLRRWKDGKGALALPMGAQAIYNTQPQVFPIYISPDVCALEDKLGSQVVNDWSTFAFVTILQESRCHAVSGSEIETSSGGEHNSQQSWE